MASAGLLPDICEDHPASGGLHGRGWKHPLFLRKIVSNDLEIKMEAGMRAIHEMLSLFKIFPPIHKSLVFIGNYNILDGK